jgi:hypothetical protein
MATSVSLSPALTAAPRMAQWRTSLTRYGQQANFYRFGWAATAALVQGCILSPALILALSINGGPVWHFLVGYVCFLGVLIPILAALPMRYLAAGFGLSLLIHLALILWNVL